MLPWWEQYSLRTMSAASCPRGLAIVLKPYLDSAGDLDSRHYKTVTVAGYCADHSDWAAIETKWRTTVSEAWAKCSMPPDVPAHTHLTNMVGFCDPFSRRNGWDEVLRDDLLNACLVIIKNASAAGYLRGATCKVDLAAYKKARQRIPKAPHVKFHCPAYCLGELIVWKKEVFFESGAEIYFDRGDPFHGTIAQRWNNAKARKKSQVWSLVKQVSQVDMTVSPAIQMADFLAWCVDAQAVQYDWQSALLSVDRSEETLDAAILSNPSEAIMQQIANLRLNHMAMNEPVSVPMRCSKHSAFPAAPAQPATPSDPPEGSK